jgi:hypothetical protein
MENVGGCVRNINKLYLLVIHVPLIVSDFSPIFDESSRNLQQVFAVKVNFIIS